MIPLPLLLLAGAGVLIAGKKKKRTGGGSTAATEETGETGETDFEEEVLDEESDEGADTGFDPGNNSGPQFGKIVAKGLRRDKRGGHWWRIKFEADGYHATLISNGGPAPLIMGEVGVTASQRAAKELLRDYFNDELLKSDYKESDFRSDPVTPLAASIGIAARGNGNGNGGGNLGGLQG